MAKFLSDRSAQRLGPALDAIESLAPRKRNAPRRRIRSSSKGGSVRQWIIVTSSSSPSEYTGDVYTGPNGDLVEEGVTVKVNGATANAFEEGYAAFGDKVEEDGEDVYYLDGYLLG
jgi:hypothetical protein